jgi:hypothetical protein
LKRDSLILQRIIILSWNSLRLMLLLLYELQTAVFLISGLVMLSYAIINSCNDKIGQQERHDKELKEEMSRQTFSLKILYTT